MTNGVIHFVAQMGLTQLLFELLIFMLVVSNTLVCNEEFGVHLQQILKEFTQQKLHAMLLNFELTNQKCQFQVHKMTNQVQVGFELNIDFTQVEVLTLPYTGSLFQQGVAQRKHGGLPALFSPDILQSICSLTVIILMLYCCKEFTNTRQRKRAELKGEFFSNWGRIATQ
jgi:hypothetical protein